MVGPETCISKMYSEGILIKKSLCVRNINGHGTVLKIALWGVNAISILCGKLG